MAENIQLDIDLKNHYTKLICIINLAVAIVALPLACIILLSARSALKSNTTTSLRLVLVVLCFDIISCLAFITFSTSVLIKRDFLEQYPLACSLSYFFYVGPILLSLWFLAIVSLERFLYIVLDIRISLTAWLAMMCTLLATIVVIGIFSIVNDNSEIMPLETYCFLSSTHTGGYASLMVISILNWISVIIVIFSYISILLLTIKTKFTTKPSTPSEFKKINSQMNIAILRVLSILFFYLLTNSYEIYLELWSIFTKLDRSQKSDFVATAMQNFNPLINCILLLLINKDVGANLATWIKDIKI